MTQVRIPPVRPCMAAAAVALLAAAPATFAQELPPGITAERLATDNQLFVTLASKALKWEVPAEPLRIVGPIYFVGTEGLGAFLFTTPEGHILYNTGMPSSGPMITASIRKLGFKPEDIRYIIIGHAHTDHAGAVAYMKQLAPQARFAVMREDVQAMEDGGQDDFHYGRDWRIMGFPPAKVDRVLRDGDVIELGGVRLTARHTPGHTRGATTWIAEVADGGRSYTVAFPDGGGFNPGYRVSAKDPSYPGITDDYRRTHHFWEMQKPDIWLAQHNEYYDLAGKRARARTEGVKAWMDPEGYRRFVAGRKRSFEDEVDKELGAPSKLAAK